MRRNARPVVFGIGLNKTGTTSLAEALHLLGYTPMHNIVRGMSDAEITRTVGDSIARGEHPFARTPRLRRYDAFFDVRAIERDFAAFDAAYPGAKFILHTRDLESWLDSRRKHVARNLAAGKTTWTSVDEEAWRTLYRDHHDRVRRYFANRPGDLLEIDVTQAEGWQRLCEFLGLRAPDEEFPHENLAAARRSVVQRTRRRLRRAARRHGIA
jgi:hypothetical protein